MTEPRSTRGMARPWSVYGVAECEAACNWFRDVIGRKDAAAMLGAVRRHVQATGHTVRVEPTIARRYRDPAARQSEKVTP